MSGFTRIGIITNRNKDRDLAVTRAVGGHLRQKGCEVREAELDTHRSGGPAPRGNAGPGRDRLRELAEWADLTVILGGDGTLLCAGRRTAKAGALLLGINLGHLGFLTEAEQPEMLAALDEVLAGRYFVDERLMLKVSLVRGAAVEGTYLALNEAVVGKGPLARMIEIEVYVDGSVVANYPADGLIVSTPTGSTAYSLSAGGPVLHPSLATLLLTPICPHTLYARTVAVSAGSEVRVVVLGRPESSNLTVDGQEGAALAPGDEIRITRAQAVTRLVRRRDWSFYDVLRRKFQEEGLRGDR